MRLEKIKVGKMVINTDVNHVVLAIKKNTGKTIPKKKRENNKLYYAINKQSGL